VVFIFFKINLKENFFYLIIFFSLYFITIYISGGRTSFFLLFFLIFSSICFIKNLRLIITFSLLILIIFGICIKFFNLGAVDTSYRIFTKTFEQIIKAKTVKNNLDSNKNTLLDFTKKIRIYSNDHEGHIRLALELFSKKKIIGIGPEGFRHYCRQVDYDPAYGICSTHPHNILIQIITELGIVGFVFYLIAKLFIIYHFLNSILKKKLSENFLSFYSITLGLIINLFPLIPGGNFFNNWISIILYYTVGLYFFSFKKSILKN
jgi:O-antigen ligase